MLNFGSCLCHVGLKPKPSPSYQIAIHDLLNSVEGDRTAELAKRATRIQAGFVELDTGPQSTHYREDLLDEVLRDCFSSGDISRELIYVSHRIMCI